MNDVTHLEGRGDLPKVDITPQAHLVKWWQGEGGGQKSQKFGDIICGQSLNIYYFEQYTTMIRWPQNVI